MLNTQRTTALLVVAITLTVAACGKQEIETASSPVPSAQATSSSPSVNASKGASPVDCDKLQDPKPADDSAAGRSTAVSQGLAARATCRKEAAALEDKPNADLARIREIKEKEQADLSAQQMSDKEYGKRLKEGARKPIHDFKY